MKTPPLAATLGEIPDHLFWGVSRGKAVPHFNRIYAEVLRRRFGLLDLSDQLALHELFTGPAPHLSSFQRAVAKEARRRRDAGAAPGGGPGEDPGTRRKEADPV